jgi:AAA+ ATPase superfamily predicted ATPase
MEFVGREREVAQIRESLEEGRNVIISGKYGIGRTSLAKHIAKAMKDQWRFIFVDFSKTPASVCHYLLVELFPMHAFDHKHIKYRSSRFRIVTLELKDKRKHVLVFDNLAKLTSPKNDLLRYLTWEKRFQFIVIVESFLPSDDLFLLRVRLDPAIVVNLERLCMGSVIRFFRSLSEEYELHWTETHIKDLAETTGGYPLRMREIALREMARITYGRDKEIRERR